MNERAQVPAALVPALSLGQRVHMLAAGFLAWMFAGLQIQLFILLHRQMMFELLEASAEESAVVQWFAWYQAAFLFGAAAGGWLFGALGDRLGRTRAMGLSVLCYSLFTLGCYYIHDPYEMMFIRWIACLGIGGVWPNAVALVAEAWPNASRPLLAGLLGTAANVGAVLLGFIAWHFAVTGESWRWMLLVGASPAIIGFWILFAVPESARWLANVALQSTRSAQRRSPIAEVLRPPLLQRTLLGIMLGAIPVVGTAANGNWLIPWSDQVAEQRAAERRAAEQRAAEQATASGDKALVATDQPVAATPPVKKKMDARSKARTMMLRSGGGVAGSLLGGIVASIVGRRLSYFLISLLAWATSSYIFGILHPGHPQFQLFTFLLGFIGVAYFGWLPLFLPELFPTRVRSTGAGISFNTGRIVAGVVALSAAVLIQWFEGDYPRVGLWTGMIYVTGMLIIWLVPRGSGGQLED